MADLKITQAFFAQSEDGAGELTVQLDPGNYYVGVSGSANESYNPLTGTGDTQGGTIARYTLVVYDYQAAFDLDFQRSATTVQKLPDALGPE